MNKNLLDVTVMTLQSVDNIVLAVSNNALTGWGKIGEQTLAYKPMRELNLIREDGRPYDKETLLEGLSYEINRRVEAGTFN